MPSVTIVGAGIVGICCARFLQRDGHRVTVLDPREPGDGASFGNAGIIASCEVAPIATPEILKRIPGMLLDPYGPVRLRWRYLPWIAPWLWKLVRATRAGRVEAIATALAALLSSAEAAHRDLLQEAGAADLLRHQGWLKVFETEAACARVSAHELPQQHGVRFDVLDQAEIRQLEPALAPIFRHALWFPDCGSIINPKRLVLALARAFAADGGTILREAATGFDLRDGERVVLTEAGRHAAGAIVLAAGAWSRPLAAALGAPVPLDTERGYHLMFDAGEARLSRPTLWGEHYINLVPMEDGLRLTSGVEFGGLAAPPDWRWIERLGALARRMLPGLSAAPRSRWLGFRPSLPDSLPVLGRAPRHRDVYFAFGHQHLGVKLGAVTGRIVADLVAGRDPGIDLSPYRAERW
jgi:D-amino-acid dehydrogenase